MERKVIVGYWYIVGGPAGATVTVLGEENPCCTVPEGGQGSFYAQAPVVVVSDESVTLSQVVNFKVAPVMVKRWLLGLGRGATSDAELPANFIPLDHIESTGYQYLVTEIITCSDMELEIDCAISQMSSSSKNMCKLAGHPATSGYTVDLPVAIEGSTTNISLKFGSVSSTSGISGRIPIYERIKVKLNKNGLYIDGDLKIDLPSADEWQSSAKLILMGSTTAGTGYYPQYAFWYGFKIYDAVNDVQYNFKPYLYDGVPCFYDKGVFLYNGKTTKPFAVGMTLAQARRLAELPATGGSLTVSLPTGYDTDEGANQAIGQAIANGWGIAVQEYTL